MNNANKVALVTGVGHGIGEAMAVRLGADGYRVSGAGFERRAG